MINLTASYAFMADEFAKKVSYFLQGESNMTVLQSDLTRFDGSLIVIWLIASLTIILGGLWTRHEFNSKLLKPQSIGEANQSNDANDVNDAQQSSPNLIENEENKKDDDHKQSLTISVGYWSILVLLLFVVGMLLMLYFFFDYMSIFFFQIIKNPILNNHLVYVIYAIFCLGAASSIYRIGCLVIDSFDKLKYQ